MGNPTPVAAQVRESLPTYPHPVQVESFSFRGKATAGGHLLSLRCFLLLMSQVAQRLGGTETQRAKDGEVRKWRSQIEKADASSIC